MNGTFSEAHILAITQSVCDYHRRQQGTDGPLNTGKDTRAQSRPAQHRAQEVLAAEISVCTGNDHAEHYREFAAGFGTLYYKRIDAPATPVSEAQEMVNNALSSSGVVSQSGIRR